LYLISSYRKRTWKSTSSFPRGQKHCVECFSQTTHLPKQANNQTY